MVRQYCICDRLRAEAANPHLGRHDGLPLELAPVRSPHDVCAPIKPAPRAQAHVQGLAACEHSFAFGPFKLRVAERLLEKDGVQMKLGSRALDILIALADRAPLVVSKKELLARAWPDLIVDEGSLRFQIAALRKVLGGRESGVRYVSNVAGRGYCFAAPVLRELAQCPACGGDPMRRYVDNIMIAGRRARSLVECLLAFASGAIQAMKSGGALTVSLDSVTLADSRSLATATLSAGEYIRLLVRDSAVGIELDVLRRIFEPFFPTQGAGAGTGLALVPGIVSDLGGAVDVESAPGQGSVFTVLLPRAP